ncbi:MAG: NusG domain II-containing protein [Candidatus Accumulibacter sp.]|uniref:NusG domain II-containing protein n=1 Tax=Accumulibacter sp. TaxID=2053492 RepID=UPI0019FD21C5|nr:NusG domain II-containing protein [Accumulibacter sp.]MBE2260801.1 NusG domain II-containing protein [Paracoccaceae bacterium]MCP5247243.1 NusG domain II-containing protein [Accumulibacter sp.]
MRWLGLLRPGDWLLIALGLLVCGLAFPLAWQAGVAEKAIVRQGGALFSELDLSRNRRIDVPGPLGTTTVVVDKRRVRVASDPGPRQYCVRQGWLARPGEIAICAPNQVSVEIQGSKRTYDSLSY